MNEAELLFSSMLDCDRLSLYLNKGLVLGKDKAEFISSALKRRIKSEPIQYILGKTEFMGFDFNVTPDVLIPRPETEILVQTVIDAVVRRSSSGACLNILDIGTGCGNIAVSLAKFLAGAKITATDISDKALEIARSNALLNNVSDRIEFVRSDLFTCGLLRDGCFDVIVSNPPYIVSSQINKLQPEIKYEPRIALDGGGDGLNFYRRLISDCLLHLEKSGLLIMEIGFNQIEALQNIFQKFQDFEIIEVVKDYNNIERVIVVRRKP